MGELANTRVTKRGCESEELMLFRKWYETDEVKHGTLFHFDGRHVGTLCQSPKKQSKTKYHTSSALYRFLLAFSSSNMLYFPLALAFGKAEAISQRSKICPLDLVKPQLFELRDL